VWLDHLLIGRPHNIKTQTQRIKSNVCYPKVERINREGFQTYILVQLTWAISSVVEHTPDKGAVSGSSPE
jgi:hypothetical protein